MFLGVNKEIKSFLFYIILIHVGILYSGKFVLTAETWGTNGVVVTYICVLCFKGIDTLGRNSTIFLFLLLLLFGSFLHYCASGSFWTEIDFKRREPPPENAGIGWLVQEMHGVQAKRFRPNDIKAQTV